MLTGWLLSLVLGVLLRPGRAGQISRFSVRLYLTTTTFSGNNTPDASQTLRELMPTARLPGQLGDPRDRRAGQPVGGRVARERGQDRVGRPAQVGVRPVPPRRSHRGPRPRLQPHRDTMILCRKVPFPALLYPRSWKAGTR